MRKLGLYSLTAILFCMGGCGPSKPDRVIEDAIDCLNRVAEVFEGIQDKESAEAAIPTLETLAEQWREIRRKLDALRLSQAEKDQLEAAYKEKMSAAEKRLRSAEAGMPAEAREVLKDVPGKFES